MDIFKLSQCPTCGGHQLIQQNNRFICSHCGNIYFNTDKSSEFYSSLNMALTLRQTAKFDDSFEIYNMITNKFADSDLSDVYFGMFLCEFSVIFETNTSGEPFPSFYSMCKTPCENNYYYKKAIEVAVQFDEKKVESFKALAEKIEYARKTYLAIKKNNRPYDIFICYKKSDEQGLDTPEAEKARSIYKNLKEQGFKVFLAEETINKQAVREWEPNIYYALYTAKAMIVMCSKHEYLNSVWVQNEWKRFISIKTDNQNRAPVIPIVCDDFKPYDLPTALSKYQALTFDKNINENIKEALLSLTKKVNDQKEFIFTYKKPLSKKVIASITSGCVAAIIVLASLLSYFYIPRLKYENFENGYGVAGNFGQILNVNIPDTHKNKPVLSVIESAFENNTSIISVTIGNNLKTIGKRAFSGMTKLKEVTMSNSVTSIGSNAFYGCENLITMTLSSGLTSISTGQFGACSNLMSITIPKSIVNIDVAAFYNCYALSVINYTGTQTEWDNVFKGINNGNLQSAYLIYNFEISDSSETQKPIVFIAPTKNYTIGKGFSNNSLQFNSTTQQWEIHLGVDFLTVDSQPVYAIQNGTVNSVQTDGFGTFFSITHAQGYVSFYYSIKNVCVTEGQTVSRGDIVAYTGTNKNEEEEGPHLHLELMKDGIKVNPLEHINI